MNLASAAAENNDLRVETTDEIRAAIEGNQP